MPTIVGQSKTVNVSDSFAKALEQNGPLAQAHAAYYGAEAAKQNEDLQNSKLLNAAKQYIASHNDPNDPGLQRALTVANMAKQYFETRLGVTALKDGALAPTTSAAQVAAGQSATGTGAYQRVAEAGSNSRNAADNQRAITTTQMTNDTSRATTDATQAGEMARKKAQIEADRALKEYEMNTTAQPTLKPDATGRLVPSYATRPDLVSPDSTYQPILTTDQAAGLPIQRALTKPVPAAPAAPAGPGGVPVGGPQPTAAGGVLSGGAVPDTIPSYPGAAAPGQPAFTAAPMVAAPNARDLTAQAPAPTPPVVPGPPGVVQPPLTPPESMAGPAPAAPAPAAPGIPVPSTMAPAAAPGVSPEYAETDAAIQAMPAWMRKKAGVEDPTARPMIGPNGEQGLTYNQGKTVVIDGREGSANGYALSDPTTAYNDAKIAKSKAMIKPFEITDPTSSKLFKAIGTTGVSGLAKFGREDIDTLLGSTGLASILLPGGQVSPTAEAAGQMVDTANDILTRGLLGARAGEAGVKEQLAKRNLLFDRGILTNPAAEAMKVPGIYSRLMEVNRQLVARAQDPALSGPEYNKVRENLDQNEAALHVLTDKDWGSKYLPQNMSAPEADPTAPTGGVTVTDKRGGGAPAPAAAPTYSHTATGQNGEKIGFNPQTNAWEPISAR